MTLYTIGYGNRQTQDFYALIPDGAIIVDVRLKPTGWNNAYRKASLLAHYGPERYWSFEALGNMSGNGDEWIPPVKPIIVDSYMNKLVSYIQNNQTLVLLCAEKDPSKCHRRIIADQLAERVAGDVEIVHL